MLLRFCRMSGTMCSEEFPITWNNHNRNIVEVLGRYLNEGTLVDCTIAAEGEYLKAHRLVLSACSAYFELFFSQEMKKEKVVVLEDVKFKDLKSLIAFMYEGRVTIPRDSVQDFVRTAELLQIRGLRSDLVEKSWRERTEMPMVCGKQGLSPILPHQRVRCSAISGESSDQQCISSISRNQTGNEGSSACMPMDLLEENVFPLPQAVLESDTNRKTAVFSAEREPLVKPKEEVEEEDTPIWETEDENSGAVTGLSFAFASAGEEVQNELTPVLGTVSSSSCSCVSSPHILENESETSIPKFSAVAATIPSTNTAEETEQSICVKNELVVKTEVLTAGVSLQRESIVEPMHAVWVEEMQSWEGEEVITEADLADTCNQETTMQDLNDASTVPDNQFSVWPNVIFKATTSSCVATHRDTKEVSAQEEETEMEKRCKSRECESIYVNNNTFQKVVGSGQRNIIEVADNYVEREEHVMEGQEMMEIVERTLETDITVERCETEEEDSVLLSEHISRMLGKKSHRCRKCPEVFRTVRDLRLHVKKQHGRERSYHCEVCMATFTCRSSLTVHMRKHTGERPFKCDVCNVSFSVKSNFTTHKRIHTGERPFQCDVCKISIGHKSQLIRHMRTHTGERPFQCVVCDVSFMDKDSLIKHMRTHTGERPFQCEVCEKTFSQLANLTTHKRIHTGERPFQCNVCERSFSTKSARTAHMRTHTGERPFQCDVCKRSFFRKNHLMLHMRTHTGERPFRCEVCEKTFSVLSNLTTHKRVHTGERPFQCEVCAKSFSQFANLTIHKRIHSGERPFQCIVCKISFNHKTHLTMHLRTHTSERPIQCNVCKRSFICISQLNTHMHTHIG